MTGAYFPISIVVGGGPSGLSIEGPFCCVVHLCRALGDRKIEKKSKKEKEEKEMKKKRKFAEILFIRCVLASL